MTVSQNQGRERRLYARYRVDLDAEIQTTQGQLIYGRVRDICSGGLFLELGLDQMSDGPSTGEVCHLHIALPDGRESARVEAEIMRMTPQGVGVRFIALLDDTAIRLGHFIGQVAAAGDERQDPSDNPAVRSLRTLSQERLPAIFDQWIAYLIEALLEYSDNAASDSHRSLASSEFGLLIQASQSGRLALQVHEAIRKSLAVSAPAKEAPDHVGQRIELALLDQEVFENWLVKSELSARLEQDLSESLGSLRAQAQQLPGHPLRPIEPENLLNMLEGLLDQAGVSGVIRRIVLRNAGYRIADALADFYRSLSLDWSRLGLMETKTGFQRPHVPRSSEVTPDTDPQDRFAPPAEPDPEPPSPTKPIATPQPPAGPTPTPPQSAPADSPSDPAQAAQGLHLRELFDRLRAQVGPDWAVPFFMPAPGRHRPRHGLSEVDLFNLPWTKERVVLTDRLVTDILSDQFTPNWLKIVLERIPAQLLSMALTHPGALLDEQHPLTALLDQVDQLARLLPNGARDDAGYQQECDHLVERLVATEAGDLPAIAALTRQMRELKSGLERLSRANQAHWISVCEIRERHRQVREAVRQRINRLLSNLCVHPVLVEVIDRGWRVLLGRVGLADGLDSPRWRRHWDTLYRLHLDTGGEAPKGVRATAATPLEVHLEQVLDGLGAVGLTAEECIDLIDRVRQALEQGRSGRLDPAILRPFTPLSPEPDDGPDTIDETIAQADWSAAIARIDALPIGTLLWTKKRGGSTALRLIWRSPDGSHLGLSDPVGKRFIGVRRSRLAQQLLRQHIVIDRPTPEGSIQHAATAALERMESQIHEHDLPDPLTGLANQRRLRQALIEGLADWSPAGWPLALGVLELDRFALMASHYGFEVSEQILKSAAELLCAQLTEARCLAYLGSGRFGVLTAIGDRDEILALGERLRVALHRLPLASKTRSSTHGFTWSLGFSLLDRRNNALPEHYLSTANLACLAAQRNGGNQVLLFREEDPLIRKQLEQIQIWAQAEDAIQAERIRLRFQPIAPLVELEPRELAQRTHHSEILLSVYDANHQPLNLGDFIAAAEALNMMRVLDRQVIETTLRWLNAYPELEGPLGSVAINISGQTIGDADFVSWVSDRLEHWAIPPERVGFELTETAAIADIERAAVNLAQMKTLGCSLYLDDFGSGLASYGYLKRLPFDYIKIDGSFIKDIVSNLHDQAIVRSFNEIAHFMGKQTVAEFVENEDILALLREIGIDHVQGYAIARPGFIDEFLARDAANSP